MKDAGVEVASFVSEELRANLFSQEARGALPCQPRQAYAALVDGAGTLDPPGSGREP